MLFMTLQAIIGQKIDQTQKFLENGTRIPVTRLWVKENVVVSHKTIDKDNYSAIQLGFGQKKKAGKAQMGQTKGAGLTTAPKFLKEVRMEKELSSVLEFVAELAKVDTADVAAMTGGTDLINVMRADTAREADTHDSASLIDQMPKRRNGLLEVPSVFE